MEEKEFFRILKKYLNGSATPEEAEFVRTYYNLFDLRTDSPALERSQKEELKNEIRSGIRQRIHEEEVRSKQRKLYRGLSLAASILLVCSLVYFFRPFQNADDPKPAATAITKTTTDIPPASNKAILTLGDGEQIALDDARSGILAKEGNVEISKTADGRIAYLPKASPEGSVNFNTITTPRGGHYQLNLPDGTKVWLNAASSIRFPASFAGNSRDVTVTGEAYFEVAKDKHKPFRVISKGQVIEVLGTHFNVNAYDDENVIKTTLLEGSVRITSSVPKTGDRRSALLKPGYQAVFSGNSIDISETDTELAVAWKNGYFEFDRQNIQAVMRQISRWYDVDVEYRGSIPTDEFVGKISRSSSISGVLRILALSNLNCELEGNKIIINN